MTSNLSARPVSSKTLNADWRTIAIKRLSRVSRGASPRPIDNPKYFDEDGEYAWVRIADATASLTYLEKTTQRLSRLGASLSVQLQPEQLFLSIAGTVGKPCITKIKACIHDGFVYFPDLPFEYRKFLFYVFDAGNVFKGLGKFGTQLNLNTETVGDIKILMPSKDTACSIVKFLDDKTARIDALIAKKRDLVDRLMEYRQSVITSVVTRGVPGMHTRFVINLYIGEVPVAWNAGKFRHYVQFRSGQIDPEDPRFSGMVLIAPNHIEPGTGRLLQTETAAEQSAESGKYWCDAGDVIYSKIRPALRKVTLAPFACLCSADMYPLKGVGGLSNDYLRWYLLSEPFSIFAVQESARVAMPKLNRETLADAVVLLPPANEQAAIVEYLAFAAKAIDSVTTHATEHIDRLLEYRSSLISAAVTGQLDISTYKPEPETA